MGNLESNMKNIDNQQDSEISSKTTVSEKWCKMARCFAIFSIVAFVFGIISGVIISSSNSLYEIRDKFFYIFLSLGISLAFIAYFIRLSCKKPYSRYDFVIGAILVFAFFLRIIIVPSFYKELHISQRSTCLANLSKLGSSVITYAEDHDGYFPAADRWCDLLFEYDKNISKDTFKCPAAKKGICHYAFNKNLDGLRLSDVPEDVVMLYEADGNWNLFGGQELLIKTRHMYAYNIVFRDGYTQTICVHYPRKNPLRWKP